MHKELKAIMNSVSFKLTISFINYIMALTQKQEIPNFKPIVFIGGRTP